MTPETTETTEGVIAEHTNKPMDETTGVIQSEMIDPLQAALC
jgi:hypothetical protein